MYLLAPGLTSYGEGANSDPKAGPKLTQNTTASLTQFKQIPKNPRTITTILTYKNKDLTEFKTSIQADTKLSISAIFWNAKGEPVFQLQDGDYVAASQKSIVDDSIYNRKPVDMTFWTKDGLTVYKEPYVLGTEKADSKLASFKPIKVSQAAQTHAGTYYLVDGEGGLTLLIYQRLTIASRLFKKSLMRSITIKSASQFMLNSLIRTGSCYQ